MAELKQRALENPNDPEIPTTLGEAQLNKVKALHDAGGDPNEIGILAMQADQSFNAALKIDPQNWEANFVKASSMYYWPADPTRDALRDAMDRIGGKAPNVDFALVAMRRALQLAPGSAFVLFAIMVAGTLLQLALARRWSRG